MELKEKISFINQCIKDEELKIYYRHEEEVIEIDYENKSFVLLNLTDNSHRIMLFLELLNYNHFIEYAYRKCLDEYYSSDADGMYVLEREFFINTRGM